MATSYIENDLKMNWSRVRLGCSPNWKDNQKSEISEMRGYKEIKSYIERNRNKIEPSGLDAGGTDIDRSLG